MLRPSSHLKERSCLARSPVQPAPLVASWPACLRTLSAGHPGLLTFPFRRGRLPQHPGSTRTWVSAQGRPSFHSCQTIAIWSVASFHPQQPFVGGLGKLRCSPTCMVRSRSAVAHFLHWTPHWSRSSPLPTRSLVVPPASVAMAGLWRLYWGNCIGPLLCKAVWLTQQPSCLYMYITSLGVCRAMRRIPPF